MRKMNIALLASTAVCVLMAATPASAQATRTWVSGVGDDVNPCSRTAPCKTFPGAISKTAANGEINCLDPGGFGTVTITKNMTIDCIGTLGGILAAGTNGVNINDVATATPGSINVILRNLTIDGAGTGVVGVNFLSGRSVTLENVNIFGFNASTAMGVRMALSLSNGVLNVNNSSIVSNGLAPATGGGIVVQPAAAGGTNALVTVNNSTIQRNGGSGILVNTTLGTANVTIRDSTISNNTNGGVRSLATGVITMLINRSTINSNSVFGVSSENGNSTVRVGSSVVHANAQGMQSVNSGIIRSYKDNEVNGNGGSEGPFTQEPLQ